jgi:hypothetical protein
MASRRYSFIREGYDPKPEVWHAVGDCLPNTAVWDFGEEKSVPVLVMLRGGGLSNIFTARFHPGDEEYWKRWVLCGRDAYIAEDVTHWHWLPSAEGIEGVETP